MLDFLGSLIDGCATILAAIIVGVAGGLISAYFSRAKDRQEKESQWRSHAIELAKLDMERHLKTQQPSVSIRPSILDFLANYRDLKELDHLTPKELYLRIEEKRISTTADAEDERVTPASTGRTASPPAGEA